MRCAAPWHSPLDPASYAFVVENMEKFPDAYMRQLLYTEVYYMARDTLVPSTDFCTTSQTPRRSAVPCPA